MKYLAGLILTTILGCTPTSSPLVPVIRVPTKIPLPNVAEEASYELEILILEGLYTLDENAAAHSVRTSIQCWIETHKNRDIISIVTIPYGSSGNNCLSRLIILSKPKEFK